MLNNIPRFMMFLTVSMLSFSALASTEQTRLWYSTSLGNQLEIQSTFGCIDKDMMFEKHVIKANTWNGKWQNTTDWDYEFSYFSNSFEGPVIKLNTSKVHRSNGSTVDNEGNDITHIIYVMRKYTPIVGIKDRGSAPYWGVRRGLLLDPACSVM